MNMNDLDDLYILLSNKKTMEYIEEPFDKKKTEEFINKYGDTKNPLVFTVLDDNHFIGYVIFHDYDETSMEIGWVIKPEYWNKGYASRLTEILLKRIEKAHKDAIIECDTHQDVSKHIALKNGFKHIETVDGLDIYKKELR